MSAAGIYLPVFFLLFVRESRKTPRSQIQSTNVIFFTEAISGSESVEATEKKCQKRCCADFALLRISVDFSAATYRYQYTRKLERKAQQPTCAKKEQSCSSLVRTLKLIQPVLMS